MRYQEVPWGLVLSAAGFVLLMVPVSILYDRKYRAVVREYAELRHETGAVEETWPPSGLRRQIFVSPLLMLLAATLATLLSVYGAVDEFLRTDPFGSFPGFVPDPRLPALGPALVAGVAVAIGLALYAISGLMSPWWPVQMRLRLAVAARGERRRILLGEALSSDPSLRSIGARNE